MVTTTVPADKGRLGWSSNKLLQATSSNTATGTKWDYTNSRKPKNRRSASFTNTGTKPGHLDSDRQSSQVLKNTFSTAPKLKGILSWGKGTQLGPTAPKKACYCVLQYFESFMTKLLKLAMKVKKSVHLVWISGGSSKWDFAIIRNTPFVIVSRLHSECQF